MTPSEKAQWATAVIWFSGTAMVVSAMPKPLRIAVGLLFIAFGFIIRVS